ncbi:MAG: acetyl-CoA carboxylase biotin carboxyl carrier protein, partial [Betaproteobacteria bacterium]|nr:acetyl-CoA carboxylase biotin carboxyl carrier protein [Betaproteobacteria bacterium]
MDLRKIKTLIDLVSESGISELEITEGEDKVRIVKHPLTPAGGQAMPQSLGYYPQPVPTMSAVSAAPLEPETIEEATGHIVKSPMVGTFYRASSPGG